MGTYANNAERISQNIPSAKGDLEANIDEKAFTLSRGGRTESVIPFELETNPNRIALVRERLQGMTTDRRTALGNLLDQADTDPTRTKTTARIALDYILEEPKA